MWIAPILPGLFPPTRATAAGIVLMKINLRQAKRYAFATHVNDMLLPRETTEVLEAFLVVIEPGKFTHPHSHADTEQLYFVLSGRGEGIFHFEGRPAEKFEMQPEDVVYVPRGVRHQIFCTDETEPLRYLCVDGFPLGRPKEEPTWDDHYQAVLELQKR